MNPGTRLLSAFTALWLAAGLGLAQQPVQAQAAQAVAQTPAACPALLNHRFARLQDGQAQSLCQYSGRVLLIVNTASYCGYTGQFEGLEKLNARYASRGLVVMGFPSNDFRQEDPDARKTAEVCFNTYGVKFPMFTETPVRGPQAHPLFAELARGTGAQPNWNFNKYLVGRDGQVLRHFSSQVAPDHRTLVAAIEQALAVK
jgi:glutathione peroxidase